MLHAPTLQRARYAAPLPCQRAGHPLHSTASLARALEPYPRRREQLSAADARRCAQCGEPTNYCGHDYA